jgi:hypothetical protein
MTTQSPSYVDTDGCTYTYEPRVALCSLSRYNIALCARQRMYDAHNQGTQDGDWFETWKAERVSFWSTLAHAIPGEFM